MSDASSLPLANLVKALRARKVVIKLADHELVIRGWARLSEPERERLRVSREELVELLQAEAEAVLSPEPEPLKTVPTPLAPEPDKPKLTEEQERAARMRREGPLSFNPAYYTEVALKDVEERDMSAYELMAARAAFAGRFGPQLDRWRNR